MIEFVTGLGVGLGVGLVVGATAMVIRYERQYLRDWREENLRKTRRDMKTKEDHG